MKVNESFHVTKDGKVRRNPGKAGCGKIKRTKKGIIYVSHWKGKTYMGKRPARMKR